MRNKCVECGEAVGNITFTVCDQCWNKEVAQRKMWPPNDKVIDRARKGKMPQQKQCYGCGLMFDIPFMEPAVLCAACQIQPREEHGVENQELQPGSLHRDCCAIPDCCSEWTRSAWRFNVTVYQYGHGFVGKEDSLVRFCPWCGQVRHNNQAHLPAQTGGDQNEKGIK